MQETQRRRPIIFDVTHNQDSDGDPVKPIPMELRTVLRSIEAYGRQTHVLGMMKAVSILKRVQRDLNRYVTENHVNDLDGTLDDVDKTIVNLQSSMSREYNV